MILAGSVEIFAAVSGASSAESEKVRESAMVSPSLRTPIPIFFVWLAKAG